jgi:hypothetical protein
MEILRIQKKNLEMKNWNKRFAATGDCSRVIENDTIVYLNDSDTPSIIYLTNAVTMPDGFVTALKKQKYGQSNRQSGLRPANLVFGYSPRNPIYARENCQPASVTRDIPQLMGMLSEVGVQLDEIYKWRNPSQYTKHSEMTEKVLGDWKIDGTVFTSGVINKNSQLPYHFDRGNFVGAWSGMVTVRNQTAGGWLSCPEIDTEIRNSNGSLLLFDGQSLLHGVTPIGYLSEKAYRFTIVYYSLAKMWQCLPPIEELKRANRVRAQREIQRASTQRANNAQTK